MTKTLACFAALFPLVLSAQDPTLVAPTDPLPPEQQRQNLHVPPGFEVQLVAAEPDIGQPMNLQFDAAGRLWVTSSIEYPYPAQGPGVEPRDENFAGKDEPHAPRDWVAVFSGIGPDGKPKKVVKFTEGLNIPIGELPLSDGSALIYGIPELDRFVDENGDGVADEKTTLITGFGNVDTHGMVNGLRRWVDGWVYACHGFRNTSEAKGADGSTIKMNSGNTFRFKPDGTRVEQFTWGQVNPFGMTFDPLGNLYNADCHSKPLTLLIRGAYYESFGKPHGGLGFGPTMIDHSHGSTGICGPAYYAATHFPPDYRDNLYLCNPVTGKVHRDKLVWTGSSPKVDTQPDFITSDDPWFRPVDLAVGPDGALYVADFHNAVIGHYEVPLAHPKRDRTTGRIWRVVYVGENGERRDRIPAPKDLTGESFEGLLEALADDNLVNRVTATHELVDKHPEKAAALLGGYLSADVPSRFRVSAMWVLERLGKLDRALLETLSRDRDRLVRTHVAKLLAERDEWLPQESDAVLRLLADSDPFARRAAADAVGRHPAPTFVRPLLDLLAATPEADSHLRYATRVALRDVLAGSPEVVSADGLSPADLRALASVLPAVKTPGGTALFANILKADLTAKDKSVPPEQWGPGFGHVVRYGNEDAIRDLITAIRSTLAGDPEAQASQISTADDALRRRGEDPRRLLGEWAQELAAKMLSHDNRGIVWSPAPLGDSAEPAATWTTQNRLCADGRSAPFWSSLPNGETRRGLLRSGEFRLPESFAFWTAGHAGFPDKPPHDRNVIRLRDAATGAVLRVAAAPRNDVAQEMTWDLSDVAGRTAFLELQDGDDAGAYAWLAVGRFGVEGLAPTTSAGPQRAAELVTRFGLDGLKPRLRELLADPAAGDATRAAAAAALVSLDREVLLAALVPLLGDPASPRPLKEEVAQAALHRQPEAIAKAAAAAMRTLPASAQQPLAERLSGDPTGAEALVALVEQGHASPRLLARPAVKTKLDTLKDEKLSERIAALTADLPAEDDLARKLIETRVRTFAPGQSDAARGLAVFTKNCANCHRIGTEGSLVGPQLDGIGVRGLDRIAEDVLDPNRNVDGAFKATTMVLADGRVVTGLVRREEGESLVLADNVGKEFTVAKDEIEERVTSPLSLMPANFGEVVPEDQFRDLMAYLLSQRQSPPARAGE